MIGWSSVLIGTWIALAPVLAASTATPKWVLKADYVDACSCAVPCPCLYGGPSTHGYCKGATLLEIKEGHYGDVDFTGVTVLAVYNGGKWVEFIVSENATKEQTDTVAEFLPAAEGFFEAPISHVSKASISVTRTNDNVTITTEGTRIELEKIRGGDGKPIIASGLPAQGFPAPPYLDHTQYKTVVLTHDGENEEFEFSKSNGFTARIDASSESSDE